MSDKKTASGTVIRDGVEYGCHLDISDGDKPGACVIDTGDYWACIYGTYKNGNNRRTEWTCKHWKPVCRPRPTDAMKGKRDE